MRVLLFMRRPWFLVDPISTAVAVAVAVAARLAGGFFRKQPPPPPPPPGGGAGRKILPARGRPRGGGGGGGEIFEGCGDTATGVVVDGAQECHAPDPHGTRRLAGQPLRNGAGLLQ